jgi:hypothetical protein
MSTVLIGLTAGPFVGTATAPVNGEDVTGESIQIVAQAILDDAAFLNDDYFSRHGGTVDGATSFTADVEFNGVNVEIQNGSAFTIQPTTTVLIQSTDVRLESGSLTEVKAGATLKISGLVLDPDTVYLTDASQTISVTGGQYYAMLTAPVAQRLITLDQSPAPPDGAFMEILILIGNTGFGVDFQREGSLDYVAVVPAGTLSNETASVKVKAKGGVWRLAPGGGGVVKAASDS